MLNYLSFSADQGHRHHHIVKKVVIVWQILIHTVLRACIFTQPFIGAKRQKLALLNFHISQDVMPTLLVDPVTL